jgi:hypothetical protein
MCVFSQGAKMEILHSHQDFHPKDSEAVPAEGGLRISGTLDEAKHTCFFPPARGEVETWAPHR